jgi:large subunit ribosomal protein L9
MNVILLKDVEKLGLKGDVVDVKRGYARNFLLPRRLAEVATPGRVAEIRRIEDDRARHEARTAEQAEAIADTLTKTVLRFEVKAGPTGSLFGSVTPTDVADEIWRTRKIRVDRRKIDIPAIKRIGRFTVPIHVYEDVVAEVKTLVVPEGGELPPEEELAAIEAAEAAEAAAEVAAAEAAAEAAAAEIEEFEEFEELEEAAAGDDDAEVEAAAEAESAAETGDSEVVAQD